MISSGGEYFQLLRDQAADDFHRGDYVTMDRRDDGFIITEKLLTFSGITVIRKVPKYACYAPAEEG